jgi:hypothetical protein
MGSFPWRLMQYVVMHDVVGVLLKRRGLRVCRSKHDVVGVLLKRRGLRVCRRLRGAGARDARALPTRGEMKIPPPRLEI